MSAAPVIPMSERAAEKQPQPLHTLDPGWRAYLLSRRRAIKLELQEIERLLELKPKQP